MTDRFCDFDELDRDIILAALNSSNRTDLPYVRKRIQVMINELDPPPSWKVILLGVGMRKIDVIKEVRSACVGMSLMDAKSLVERAPMALPEAFTKEAADRVVTSFLNAGATAEVRG